VPLKNLTTTGAELEHQTAKDTTQGAAKPMGTRGAEMADTVASAR
jgi:membrane protein